MPIKIRRAGVVVKENPDAVIVVSREVDEFDVKPQPPFRIGPAKGEAETIAVPSR